LRDEYRQHGFFIRVRGESSKREVGGGTQSLRRWRGGG
jgi:hypothetical protein